MKMPGPALLVALAALGVALSSPAMSTVDRLITGSDVKNRSLTAADVRKSSLTGAEIRNGTLQAADLSARAKAALATAGPAGAAGERGPTGPAGPVGPEGDPGPAGSDASLEGVAAGGALAGTYPNPSLKVNGVDSLAITNDTITQVDLDTESFIAGFPLQDVPAGACVTATPTIPSQPPVNLATDGSIVFQKSTSPGLLPAAFYLPVYTVIDGTLVARVCNGTAAVASLPAMLIQVSRLRFGPGV